MINFEKYHKYSVKNNNGKIYEFILEKIGKKYLYGYIEYSAFSRDYEIFIKDSLTSKNGVWKIEEDLGYRTNY